MKGRRLPFAICLAFATVGLAMVVFGDAPTRVAGASSLLFFGGGSLALAMPLLTRRVKVSDPQRIERRNGPLARLNRTLVPVDIVIAADQLAGDPEAVLRALVTYHDLPERRRQIGTPDELARVL